MKKYWFDRYDLLGKEFTVTPKRNTDFNRYRISHNDNADIVVRRVDKPNNRGAEHSVSLFNENLNNGDWLFVASEKQEQWLTQLFQKNKLKLSGKETELLINVINRVIPYYTLEERNRLNRLHKKFSKKVL